MHDHLGRGNGHHVLLFAKVVVTAVETVHALVGADQVIGSGWHNGVGLGDVGSVHAGVAKGLQSGGELVGRGGPFFREVPVKRALIAPNRFVEPLFDLYIWRLK